MTVLHSDRVLVSLRREVMTHFDSSFKLLWRYTCVPEHFHFPNRQVWAAVDEEAWDRKEREFWGVK